jgi:hypothetical protein
MVMVMEWNHKMSNNIANKLKYENALDTKMNYEARNHKA